MVIWCVGRLCLLVRRVCGLMLKYRVCLMLWLRRLGLLLMLLLLLQLRLELHVLQPCHEGLLHQRVR